MEEAKGSPTKFVAGALLLGVTWYGKGACIETYTGQGDAFLGVCPQRLINLYICLQLTKEMSMLCNESTCAFLSDLVPHLLEAALQMVFFEYEDVFWTGQVVDEINEGCSVAFRPDPDSIKDKYYRIDNSASWVVRHEDVVHWRFDFRGTVTPKLLSLAHQAVIVHGIDWYKHEQFVNALAKV